MNKTRVLTYISLLFFLSCSSESNPLVLSVSQQAQNSFQANLTMAQALYDQARFAEALKYAKLAFQQHSESEEAAILLGYTLLAQGGLTPYQAVKKIVSKRQTKNEETGGDDAENTGEKSKSASNTMGQLSGIVGLKESDYLKLGEVDKSDEAIPVIIPFCADQARSKLKMLKHANEAIKVICPFVDKQVKVKDERRHYCKQVQFTRENAASSHFLWILAHLVEALTFHGVITYSTNADKTPNIEQKVAEVTKLPLSSPTEISVFIEKTKTINEVVSKVVPISLEPCSPADYQYQFDALVSDMLTVDAAFKLYPSIPKDISGAITESMSKIQDLEGAAGDQLDSSGGQKGAMKGDITGKMAEKLNAKIESIGVDQYSEEQVDDICEAFDGISGGVGDKPFPCLTEEEQKAQLEKEKKDGSEAPTTPEVPADLPAIPEDAADALPA